MDHGAGSYRRFLEGDKTALVEIVSQYRPGLQNYIYSIVNNIAVAEDLTEDTFVKLFTKKPKNKDTASFKTWLYSIGRNLALDWLRKNPQGRYISIDEIRNLESDAQELAELYFRDEERKAVRAALNHINPDYRNVLMLFYFEDFDIAQIAKILKKTKKSTSVLLHRARNALKNQLLKENFTYEIR